MRGLLIAAATALVMAVPAGAQDLARIGVSDDRTFIAAGSGERFTPWGFNYDRDADFRLIEEYWSDEWATVEEDFAEMKALGANTVRIHLQFNRFMDAADTPNEENLARLGDLIALAERLGLYLDLTGLGSYRNDDPQWYAGLPESGRWAAQAAFWEAIAKTGAGHPAVFAYNLMNEPIVTGTRVDDGAWINPTALEGLHYIQYINLDAGGRDRGDIAIAWIRQMREAIRRHDPDALVTVGQFPFLGLIDATGFPPGRVAAELDYLSVHLYPEAGAVEATLDQLEAYAAAGRPVVIEETFPLNSSLDEHRAFLERSRASAAGWLTFYWGRSPEELAGSSDPGEQLTAGNLLLFSGMSPP